MTIFREFRPGRQFLGRLTKGSDIIQSLEAFCAEHGVRAAWVNVLGALDKATISYYDQEKHQYFHRELRGEAEIVSCIGNISIKDEKPFAHLHIVLSDTQYQTLGGHLWPGTVSVFAAEFVIFEMDKTGLDDDLVRCPDAETGLALW